MSPANRCAKNRAKASKRRRLKAQEGVPVVLEQLWEAFHNCPDRRSIVMEGNYNLSQYYPAFFLNLFP